MPVEFSDADGKSEKEVVKMVHKLKLTFSRYISKGSYPVIETDYEKNGEKVSDLHEEEGSIPEDPRLQAMCLEVVNHIEDGLKYARDNVLKCDILIPCGLTRKIARDILIMSESEPCGIRGCGLSIHLQDKVRSTKLSHVQCDPSTVSTFEIHLTFHEDTRHWIGLKKMMMRLTGCFKHSIYRTTPKMLCQAYKLEKQKLYRPNC